jgi:hypothetical protein
MDWSLYCSLHLIPVVMATGPDITLRKITQKRKGRATSPNLGRSLRQWAGNGDGAGKDFIFCNSVKQLSYILNILYSRIGEVCSTYGAKEMLVVSCSMI